MTPPLLGVEEEGRTDVSVIGSSPSVDCVSRDGLKERNYLGLSESSVDSSAASSLLPEENDCNLNLKATELRLGLPGSQSPERDPEICLLSPRTLDEKALFPLAPFKDVKSGVVSGNKRGYADTMDGLSEVKNSVGHVLMSPRSSVTQPAAAIMKETPKILQEPARAAANATGHNYPQPSSNNNGAPAAKAQVVGWPPIRSFRKNTLATTSKNNEEVDGKPGPGALFVKVSMDGAPYLRKVDLRTYPSYQELSSALEKMFSCFTIGQCGSHGAPGREMLSESKLRDLLHGSEYVLTYEDKDSDWMLVGDVPWEMFIESCKRLKIMKSSDAIGLAPRAMEKSKNHA